LEEQKNQQNRELKIVKQPDSSASDADMMEDDLIFIDLDADAVKKKRTSIKHKADTERVHKKRRKRKRKKKRRKKTAKSRAVKVRDRLLLTGIIVLLLFLCLGCGALLYRGMGYRRLQRQTAKSAPELHNMQETENPLDAIPQVEAWQDDWVIYQEKVYDYNEDILTFLFMGIDKSDETVQKISEGTDGGQADALFLLVMDPHDQTVDIIGINRNAMTAIDMYDEQGEFVDTITAQIAIQHGFGNGVEESCEYQTEAVSRLFYELPIHGYVSLNMSAITKLNDTVGGVDVTVLEDLTKIDASLSKGSQVHLEGESAFWYVKYRDTSVKGSADTRLERQKQYLKSFADAAKAAARKNPSVIMDLYQTASPMMVTNLSMDEAFYLATEVLDYRITEDSFHMTAGETTEGELFEEFYIDETALYELILEVFYEPVLISG
jgi:LCP family protein required for cell wall assembly